MDIFSLHVNNSTHSLMRLGKMEKQRGEGKEADKKSKEESSCLVYKILSTTQKIKPQKETLFLRDVLTEKITKTNEVHHSFEQSRQGACICI